MQINDFFTFGQSLKSLFDDGKFNLDIFIMNILVIFVIFLTFYDLNPKDIIREKKFMTLLSLIILVDIIIECTIGDIVVIDSILSFFLVNIGFMLKDKELFKQFTNRSDNLGDRKVTSFSEIEEKIQKLGKNNANELNILDVLYIYDYITIYQRRKVMQKMIYNDVDNMVDFLTIRPAVTEEELKEARAILNLININGKIITKDEAMLYLIKLNSNAEGESNNETSGNN